METDVIVGVSDFGTISMLMGPSLILGALIWAGFGTTLAFKDTSMERTSRVAQLYGYTVCLVSLVTLLFTVPSLVDHLFQLDRPLYNTSGFPGFEPSLASFDAYKATYDRIGRMGERRDSTAVRPSEEDMRKQYEALRAARLEENEFQAKRQLVRECLLLALAGGLFFSHWRWLRHRSEDPIAAA